MNIVVTGCRGQLGSDIIEHLNNQGIPCIGAGIEEFDITDFNEVEQFLHSCKPQVVIHCAAYTAVDKAEEEKELCRKVNVDGTENIAKVCKKMNAALLYISTDYVFSGEGEDWFTVSDNTVPLNWYGQTKLDGEAMVKQWLTNYFIVRISWVFGKNGNNFVNTMLKLGKVREEITVVNDQIGSPTYTKDLAVLLCEMIKTKKYGVYHATNEGICSWAEFAEEIFKMAGYETKVKKITTKEYVTAATRPQNSRLSKQSLFEAGFGSLPDWKDALKRFISDL